jgi:hypothetical protein
MEACQAGNDVGAKPVKTPNQSATLSIRPAMPVMKLQARVETIPTRETFRTVLL